METVIATGIIRTAADALRAGSDVETALRDSSKGTPRHVLELVLERLRRAIRRRAEGARRWRCCGIGGGCHERAAIEEHCD